MNILFLLLFYLFNHPQEPSTIKVYYMTDDPWGWLGDSAYSADQLMQDYPNCLIIENKRDLSLLNLTLNTPSLLLHNNDKEKDMFDYSIDARFVIQITLNSSQNTIILGMEPSDVCLYNSIPFINSDYYNRVCHYLSKKDRSFRKWYKLHYHCGQWHFYYWKTDKQVNRIE